VTSGREVEEINSPKLSRKMEAVNQATVWKPPRWSTIYPPTIGPTMKPMFDMELNQPKTCERCDWATTWARYAFDSSWLCLNRPQQHKQLINQTQFQSV